MGVVSIDTPDPASPYDALAELYDEWVVSVVEDVPFYLRVAELARDAAAGAPSLTVLELGAGSGRISVPLALRGCRVIALDTAGGQLARLRMIARAADIPDEAIELVEGDMLDLDKHVAPASVDLVIAPFRSLLHVAPQAPEVFAQVRRALRAGGLFAFDVFHPDQASVDEFHDRWLLRRRFAAADGNGTWSVWERARFDLDAHLLELEVRCDFRASATAPEAVVHDDRYARMELHTPSPHAWRDALEAAGFAIESVYGWFDDKPFEPGDQDSIWLARAPA